MEFFLENPDFSPPPGDGFCLHDLPNLDATGLIAISIELTRVSLLISPLASIKAETPVLINAFERELKGLAINFLLPPFLNSLSTSFSRRRKAPCCCLAKVTSKPLKVLSPTAL